MSTERIATDAGGRDIFFGSLVRICDDVAHLYEDGRRDVWIAELDNEQLWRDLPRATPGTHARADGSPVLRLTNTATGTWVRAPATWVTLTSAARSERNVERDDLRELALVFSRNCNESIRGIINALIAWGIDYVHRTNPPEDPTEPLFPSGTIQKIIGSLISLGELTPSTAYSAADIVAAIERLPKRQHDCGVPPVITEVLEKYHLDAIKAASAPKVLQAGNIGDKQRAYADVVADILDEQFAKAEMYDDLKARFDAIAKAMGNV